MKFPKPEVLSRIAQALDVAVYELLKDSPVPDDHREVVNRLSEDITKNVNLAMAEIFKRYLDGPKR